MLKITCNRAALNCRRLISKRLYAASAASTPAAGTSSVLKLQFALPHETLFKNETVKQVNLPLKSGQVGVLANHVPMLEQLDSGVVEVFEEGKADPKKYFVSGGFATMQPDSTLSITSVEAFPLESFSKDNVSSLINEAKKQSDSPEAAIRLEVLEKLATAIK